jgi:hypothetical protein
MIECVQIYLEAGIPALDNSDTINRKNIKLNFGEDFLDYFATLDRGKWLDFTNEYLNFLNINDIDKKDYSKIKFKKALKTSAELFNGTFETLRNQQNNNKNEFKVLFESDPRF